MTARKTLTSIVLAGALAFGNAGCDMQSKQQYKHVPIAELNDSSLNKKVAVVGIPIGVAEHNFIISNEQKQRFVVIMGQEPPPDYARVLFGVQYRTGIYSEVAKALEEISGGRETVSVYGIYEGKNTVRAHSVDVKGTLYKLNN